MIKFILIWFISINIFKKRMAGTPSCMAPWPLDGSTAHK